jgi:hypothetical protein
MIRVFGFLALILASPFAQAESYLTGYKLAASAVNTVYLANGNWYKITNGSGSKNYFIPSKTAAEANAFVANAPGDLSLSLTNAPSCLTILNYQLVTTDGNQTVDSDGPGGNAAVTSYCDMTTDGGGWTLVVNQNAGAGGFFPNGAGGLNINPSDPSQNTYSILFTLEGFRRGGIFTFKLAWPGYSPHNIWSQTTNPAVDQPVAGYTPITVQLTSEGWGGVERQASLGGNAIIDGTVGVPNWYYAIGSYSGYGAGLPAGDELGTPSFAAPQVQFWVK